MKFLNLPLVLLTVLALTVLALTVLALTVLALTVLAGCSAYSGGGITLKEVRPVESRVATNDWDAPLKIDVGSFQDRRQSIDMGSFGGEALFSTSNVALVVQRAVEQSLQRSGARLSKFSAPTLRGDVERWYVDVRTGFPSSEMKADAGLAIELLDRHGTVRYQGKYTGSNQVAYPFATQDRMSTVLEEAMHQAIAEMLSDRRLVEVIRDLNRPE